MALETGTFISDLVVTNPPDTDPRSQGAGHLRLIKAVLLNTFPITGLGFGVGTATGTASALVLALTNDPGGSITPPGMLLVKALGPNTITNPTITVGVRSPITITKNVGLVLALGDIISNQWIWLAYNGTTYDLLNPSTVTLSTQANITGNITLTVADVGIIKYVTATADITMPAASTVAAGASITFKSQTTGNVRFIPNGADTFDGVNSTLRLPSLDNWTFLSNGTTGYALIHKGQWNIGDAKYSGSPNTPLGFLSAATAPWSRTTYAGLFAEIGTTMGAGDGSTTFGERFSGRFPIGAGIAPSFSDALSGLTVASNLIPVTSNADKYITGMAVVTTGNSITGLTNGAYFIARSDATHIGFATTLANAQNGTLVGISGTGVGVTITWTGTSRALGSIGGEEAHAITINEMLAHNHFLFRDGAGGGPGLQSVINNAGTQNTSTTGGNSAMNIMSPYVALNTFVKT
jgi:hypothetical protein